MPAEELAGRLRLSDLRRAQPDATLRNLLGVLTTKLELCGRLPVFEYEARSEGHESCALTFRELADRERESFERLLASLRGHIDQTDGVAGPRRDAR